VYARNRFLRIYPALWINFVITLLLLGVVGQLDAGFVHSREFGVWIVGQLSIVQVFNPAHLRDYGIGVINGSLWTIPIELSFYAFIPILYRIIDRMPRAAGNYMVLAMAAASFVIEYCTDRALAAGSQGAKYVHLTLAPYLYMFLFGFLAQRNIGRLLPAIRGSAVWWTAAALGAGLLHEHLQEFGLLAFALKALARVTLALSTLSAAYSIPTLADRLLRRQDFSYGIYIYHCLVINVLVSHGYIESLQWYALAVLLTFGLGAASWYLVESRALALKRGTIHKDRAAEAA
jgi:peptidoglycan/LPS O-acetylase OafA/YrhL